MDAKKIVRALWYWLRRSGASSTMGVILGVALGVVLIGKSLLWLSGAASIGPASPVTNVFGLDFTADNTVAPPSVGHMRLHLNTSTLLIAQGAGFRVQDSASPLGVPLLSATDSSGATTYFSASAAGLNSAALTFLDGESASASGPGTGKMIYNANTQTFQVSTNGGGFASLTTGGVTFPITNGSSTVTFNYGGAMSGSSLAYQFDSTDPYGVGDEAFSLKSSGSEFLKVVQNFFGIWDIESDNANIGLISANGDGVRVQGANTVYVYGAGATQVRFLANNGMDPASAFPMYNGTAANPWSYVTGNTLLTPIGGTLTSGATITPTQSFHKVSGTSTITTIATGSLPTSFNGLLALTCTGACAFATGGNILTNVTGATNKTFLFWFDGTNWSVVGGG